MPLSLGAASTVPQVLEWLALLHWSLLYSAARGLFHPSTRQPGIFSETFSAICCVPECAPMTRSEMKIIQGNTHPPVSAEQHMDPMNLHEKCWAPKSLNFSLRMLQIPTSPGFPFPALPARRSPP